nr:immunoglobulin heavy chain junction region [Macaca mulatta]MOW99454.1 immunoglobulin heavy chain junction region [Macaca mulatta]MOX00764.1 immunoglobulin heavy chain junction region [Macaca mulatta]MOX02716.1 immunoglobulin heavy chain junction region [Macaca mulatta]MOX05900.1 immunoglobulin heavy chain junction region [Macaca mulatta]
CTCALSVYRPLVFW